MIGLDLMASPRDATSPGVRVRHFLAGFADVLGEDKPKYGSGGEGDQGPPAQAKKAEETKKTEPKEKDAAAASSFDFGGIITALSSVRQGIQKNITDDVQRGDDARTSAQNTQASITADRDAVSAMVKASIAADRRSKTTKADVEAARAAVISADKMAQLPGVDKVARLTSAQDSVARAKDPVTKAAAERALARLQSGAAGAAQGAAAGATSAPRTGALSKPIVGPVKVWHALVGALAAATAGVLVYKRKAKA